MQHEVTDVQKLLDKQGYVVTPGWARRPVWQYNRENIAAPSFRIKEWDYYLAGNEHYAVAFTLSDLGYAGLRCNLCKVAWGLAVHGLESGWKENLKPYKNKGQILYFSSYHDGVNYQKENHLEQTTYVLPLVDREKELYIAA